MWTACWRGDCARRAGPFRLRAKRFGETRRSLGGGGWTRRQLDGFFFVFFGAVLAPARHDAERAHLAVQIAALHAERFCRARDVSLLKRQLLENVLALELIAGRIERHGGRPFVGWRVRH